MAEFKSEQDVWDATAVNFSHPSSSSFASASKKLFGTPVDPIKNSNSYRQDAAWSQRELQLTETTSPP
jgi:hypothetical protein